MNLAEDPRVRGGGAADHDAVAAGVLEHAHGVFGAEDVAVAHYGNRDGLLEGGDQVPVGVPGVALRASAAVQRDALQADVFGDAADLAADDVVVVPAGAELAGERDRDGAAHLAEDLRNQGQVAQQTGAAVALDDLLHRAAEVHVDAVEAKILDHASGVGQDLGLGAEKLGDDRMFVGLVVEVVEAGPPRRLLALGLALGIGDDAVRAGELGHDQTAPAQAADEAAKDRVGHARHGGEGDGGRQLKGAEAQLLRNREHSFDFTLRRVSPLARFAATQHVSGASVWNRSLR